jgi:hypothetical protein
MGRCRGRSALACAALVVATTGCGGDAAQPAPDGSAGFDAAIGPGAADARPSADAPVTTQQPACGNGVRDGDEACEGADGCPAGQRCTADCACAARARAPVTSKRLIAEALAAGVLDRPTALVYRAYALFGDPRLPPEYDGELRRREDQELVHEASRTWGSLPEEARAALEPFLVRPTDPRSIYFPPPALARRAAPAGSLAEANCPFAQGAATPDWRPTGTAHFVVWSCGGGDPAGDPDAALRTIVAGVAEEAYGKMVPEAAAPRPDSFAAGPAPQSRMDIYIVTGAQCKDRQGTCAPLEPDEAGRRPLAAVVPVPPCDRDVNGALTSSAFMLIDRDSVAAGGTFRYVFAHELFHAIANAMNLEAQGAGCFDPRNPTSGSAQSWLSEASAEWAAWAFFADDGRLDRANLFLAFQEYRPADQVSLLSIEDQRPYEAFLYPFFVQHEHGGARGAFLDVWKRSASARTPADLDDLLDGAHSFSAGFRDFTVRNFNSLPELPGSERHHQGQDSAIPANEKPDLLRPGLRLAHPGVSFRRHAVLQPLTAQYEHYTVEDVVRHVRFDAGPLSSSVDLDALVNVRGSWQRRKARAGVLELCRERPEDDVSELYLIVTNHARRRGEKVDGDYDVQMRATCPAGWSGSIEGVLTVDEDTYVSDAAGVFTSSSHKRMTQTWTIVGNTPGVPPLQPDRVETRWHGRLEQTTIVTAETPACRLSPPTQGSARVQRQISAGEGRGDRSLAVTGFTGMYYLMPTAAEVNTIEGTIASFAEMCDGQTFEDTRAMAPEYENLTLLLFTPDFSPLVAPPGDADHFTGRATVLHDEQPTTGGSLVLDLTFTWDLRRVPAP